MPEGAEDLPPETPPQEPTEAELVIELQAQLVEAKAERLRAVAEAENTRKRAEREIANIRKYASEPLARDFLQVGEFIRMALQSVTEEQAEADPLLRTAVDRREKDAARCFRAQSCLRIVLDLPTFATTCTRRFPGSRSARGIEPGQSRWSAPATCTIG